MHQLLVGSRGCSISIVIVLGTVRPMNLCSVFGTGNRHIFSTASAIHLVPTQLPVNQIPGALSSDQLTASNVEFKNISTPSYALLP
jgi:hypothetical protein